MKNAIIPEAASGFKMHQLLPILKQVKILNGDLIIANRKESNE